MFLVALGDLDCVFSAAHSVSRFLGGVKEERLGMTRKGRGYSSFISSVAETEKILQSFLKASIFGSVRPCSQFA